MMNQKEKSHESDYYCGFYYDNVCSHVVGVGMRFTDWFCGHKPEKLKPYYVLVYPAGYIHHPGFEQPDKYDYWRSYVVQGDGTFQNKRMNDMKFSTEEEALTWAKVNNFKYPLLMVYL